MRKLIVMGLLALLSYGCSTSSISDTGYYQSEEPESHGDSRRYSERGAEGEPRGK